MKLHMLGLPHTRTTDAFSHCAFTGKVRRFAKMMQPLGFECIHYGVGLPDSPGWSEAVEVLTPEEQVALLGYDPAESGSSYIGRAAHIGNPLYVEFNRRLRDILESKVSGDDVVCLPFGIGHEAALTDRIRNNHAIESGIGYPDAVLGWRIFESHAWMHWHLGKMQRHPFISEWVVPNYFDVAEWPLRERPTSEGYVLYMGRLEEVKGINVVYQLAKRRPDLRFVMCGQGDPSPWQGLANLEYRPPVHGMARAELIHGARCTLMPSTMVEPFGGVSIESMLTGTPCIASDHSAFVENIPPVFRGRTAPDFLKALDAAMDIDAPSLQAWAQARWSLEAIGPKYAAIFHQLPEMRRSGFNMGV